MTIKVTFYSYFKDLTGTDFANVEVPPGCRLGDLLAQARTLYPELEKMRRSTLVAVGVDYQDEDFVLSVGDEVYLFPPVQGG
jgi:molybdopterin converting factor small subunit